MFGYGIYTPLNAYVIDWLGGTSVSIIVTLVVRLIVGIGWYKMFEKAGKRPWMAFIPVVGAFQAFRIAWDDFAFASIFAGSTFVAWVNIVIPNSGNAIITALSILNLILWWIMAGFTAMAFETTAFFGLIYGFLPWLGALVFGFSSFTNYTHPWSSDPIINKRYEKEARKKARKLQKANKKKK